MKDLVIIGAGGHGRELAWLVERINSNQPTWTLIGFMSEGDSPSKINGIPVFVGTVRELLPTLKTPTYFVVAVGDNKARQRLQLLCEELELLPATLIDPALSLSSTVTVGDGSQLCPSSLVTTNVSIGKGVIVNHGATVAHDCVLDDFAFVAPGATLCGNVSLGKRAFVAAGATVVPGITIGDDAVVGAGAVVRNNVPSSTRVLGVPARPA